MEKVNLRNQVYGVDFSGASDAGKKIWLARGIIEGDSPRIEWCQRGDCLPGSGKRRDRCLVALRELIGKATAAVFGLDFPFGLPQALVAQEDWESFVLSFPERYPSPGAFRHLCREAAGGRELRRATDRESRTPFSPYNLRLYRQTYFGLRDVLHPLVRDGRASVLPMQRALPDRAWLLEICPASTLKREGRYRPYKGRTDEHRAARASILEQLEAADTVSIPDHDVRSAVLEDRGGDALDSVIAALAAFRALRAPTPFTVEDHDTYALEGYVYV